MIKKNQKLLNIINALLDAILMFLAYLVATYIRFDLLYGPVPALQLVWNTTYFQVAVLYALFTVLIYHKFRLYGSFRFKTLWAETRTICIINILGIAFLTAFFYVIHFVDFSRLAIFMFLVFSTAFVVGKRIVLRLLLRHFRKLGYNQKHVVVVGNGSLAKQYIEDVRKRPYYGFHIAGYVSRAIRPELGNHLGAYEDLDVILSDPSYDEVIIALEAHEVRMMPVIMAACEKSGVKISVIPFYNNYIPANPTIDVIGESKLFNLRTSPLDNVFNAVIKRACDIIGSLLLLVITSPIMLVAVIGIKLSSPGPIIFRQERVGLNKRIFTMYKFRSMRVNGQQDTAWSTDVDPRKTAFGSFLRKTSIDELPQLINVLKGDMSLIGPRPEIPHYVEQFKETIPLYMVKHQIRPGITGWAQVKGYRGDTSIEGRIKCDLWYIENWSIWLDIRIVFMTIFGGLVNREKMNL